MVSERNVVVLCLDSVRKDFFDDFATRIRSRADLSFEQCRAASSWSVPSHASMISGKLPSEHNIHSHNKHFNNLSKENTIFGDLVGHVSLGASANVYASSAYGFDHYFDSFYDFRQSNRFPSALDPSDLTESGLRKHWQFIRKSLVHDRTIESLLNGFIPKINKSSKSSRFIPRLFDDGTKTVLNQSECQIASAEEPFLSFCNLMESHIPHCSTRGYDGDLYPNVSKSWKSDEYDVWDLCETDHPDYWKKRREIYSATVEYLDKRIINFIENVQATTRRETTIVITSDHGENHGTIVDGELANHKSSLSEGLLHIPLEIVNPPRAVAMTIGDLQERPISHLKLRKILESLALDKPLETSEWGMVLSAEIVGMSEGPDPPDNYNYWDRAIRCCIRDEEKVTWDSRNMVERYKIDDSNPNWQLRDAEIDSPPSWAAEQFKKPIDEYKRQADLLEGESQVSDDVESRLESLGYR